MGKEFDQFLFQESPNRFKSNRSTNSDEESIASRDTTRLDSPQFYNNSDDHEGDYLHVSSTHKASLFNDSIYKSSKKHNLSKTESKKKNVILVIFSIYIFSNFFINLELLKLVLYRYQKIESGC